MDLSQIYTEVITEHNRSSRHRGQLDGATYQERGHNPSCGDDITLQLKIEEGIIKKATFTGSGCAISQASTSMMIDLIEGNSLVEAKQKTESFLAMIKGDIDEEALIDLLEEATILSNIRHMPARVKCAVLSWHTLNQILKKEMDK